MDQLNSSRPSKSGLIDIKDQMKIYYTTIFTKVEGWISVFYNRAEQIQKEKDSAAETRVKSGSDLVQQTKTTAANKVSAALVKDLRERNKIFLDKSS